MTHAAVSLAPQVNLTTKQLAERWHVTPGHLANLRAQGRGLPYTKLGGASGRALYRLSDVEAHERLSLVQPVAA